MATRSFISAPILTINNVVISYEQSSLSYQEGTGERKVKTFARGGEATEQLIASDIDTFKGMVKVTIPSTADNTDIAVTFARNGLNNVITLSESAVIIGSVFTRTFNSMSLINHHEVKIGPDATIELEFEGSPAV